MATGDEKIVQYLQEARATEDALVRTLQAHIAMTPRDGYRTMLERHLRETEAHRDRIDRRLDELGEGRNVIEAGVGALQSMVGQVLALSKGPLDMVRGETGEEKLVKNAKDEMASEALEIATYRSIEALARHVGDEKTLRLAERNRADEEKTFQALQQIIPELTEAAARAQVVEPSFDPSTTGAADAARDAARSGREAIENARRRILDASREAFDRLSTAARDAIDQIHDAAERGSDVVEATSRAALAAFQETARQSEQAIRDAAEAARKGAEQTGTAARRGAQQTERAAERGAKRTSGTARRGAKRTRTQAKRSRTQASRGTSSSRASSARGTSSRGGSSRRSSSSGTQPWPGYDGQKVGEINKRITGDTDADTLRKVRDYERRNKKRQTILETVDRKLT